MAPAEIGFSALHGATDQMHKRPSEGLIANILFPTPWLLKVEVRGQVAGAAGEYWSGILGGIGIMINVTSMNKAGFNASEKNFEMEALD